MSPLTREMLQKTEQARKRHLKAISKMDKANDYYAIQESKTESNQATREYKAACQTEKENAQK